MTTSADTNVDVQERPTWPQIVLTGFMGAGKSTLGALLAERLRAPFYDSDTLIEAATGLRIAELFRQGGEASFRELEHQVIASVAAKPGSVLALGGGSLMHPDTRRLLSTTYIVYLAISPTMARERIANTTDRPLARTANFDELLNLRESTYRSAASLIIEVRDEEPTKTLARVIASLPDGFNPI